MSHKHLSHKHLSPKHLSPTVADAAIFVHCTKRQRERLEALSSVVEVAPGYELTTEGRIGLEFGVIIEGTAEVNVHGHTVTTVGPGDHYGEVALLERAGGHPDRARRTATITATTRLRVAVMTVQEFATVLAEFPDVADIVRRAARDRAGAALAIS
jgi:CRP-like cAMP-binding protein